MSSPNLSPLEQLFGLNTSLPEFNDRVSNILREEAYRQLAKRIDGIDAVRLIDFLDGVRCCASFLVPRSPFTSPQALDVLDPASSGFRRCLRELRNICGAKMILPTLYTPPSQVLTIGRQPVASGSSSDVYEGTLDRLQVCVKRVRIYSTDGPEVATKVVLCLPFSYLLLLTRPLDALPRDRSVETLESQEHRPSPRHYHESSPAHF